MRHLFIHTHTASIGVGALILRLMFGAIMFAHGAQKALGWFGGEGLEATTTGLATFLSVPLFLAYLSVFAEFIGGLGLISGLFTRFFAIAVFINMLVASSVQVGFFAPKGFEYPLAIAFAALAIFFIGPGRYSLDHLLFHKKGDNNYDTSSTLR